MCVCIIHESSRLSAWIYNLFFPRLRFLSRQISRGWYLFFVPCPEEKNRMSDRCGTELQCDEIEPREQ